MTDFENTIFSGFEMYGNYKPICFFPNKILDHDIMIAKISETKYAYEITLNQKELPEDIIAYAVDCVEDHIIFPFEDKEGAKIKGRIAESGDFHFFVSGDIEDGYLTGCEFRYDYWARECEFDDFDAFDVILSAKDYAEIIAAFIRKDRKEWIDNPLYHLLARYAKR